MTGEQKGKGFVQSILKLIIAKLPEYQHQMPLTTLVRGLSDIKSGKFVCHPSLFITKERQKYMYFSQAAVINPTNRIIAKKGRLDALVTKNYVDLKAAIQYENLSFALAKGRSYSEKIDDIISLNLKSNNIFYMPGKEFSSIFKMIALERIDITLAYPFEFKYYLDNNPAAIDKLSAYQIADFPLYVIGSIGCPKNEWGKQIIEKIDVILEELKPTDEYKQAVTRWWEYEQAKPQFKQFYQDVFLTH